MELGVYWQGIKLAATLGLAIFYYHTAKKVFEMSDDE